MDARCGARTIPRMIGCARSWEREGAWLLVVVVTSLGEQWVEVWLVGSPVFLLAYGVNGLLLHVT